MNSRAQASYLDFAIGMLLFIITLVVYYSYTNNIQKEEKDVLDVMLTEAQSISSSLLLSGYPEDWDNNTVVRIGVADDQRLNAGKLRSFKRLNYTRTKQSFGTPYEYFAYFVGKDNAVLNINGICGVGHPLVNLTYKTKSAYYYQDPSDSFLKDFMINSFKADLYFDEDPDDTYDIDGLASNLTKYDLVVMEHPKLQPSKLDQNYREFNNYTARGGNLIIGGLLVDAASGLDLNGITFDKKTGQSEPQRIAVVNNTDVLLGLEINQTMTFNQYYFVYNDTPPVIVTDQSDDDYNPVPADNYEILAAYNKTPEDEAIAKWQYGNGTVYFFSDFDVINFDSNFIEIIEDVAKGLAGGNCISINLTGINVKNLVKTERYLIYGSDIVKMVVYVWQ